MVAFRRLLPLPVGLNLCLLAGREVQAWLCSRGRCIGIKQSKVAFASYTSIFQKTSSDRGICAKRKAGSLSTQSISPFATSDDSEGSKDGISDSENTKPRRTRQKKKSAARKGKEDFTPPSAISPDTSSDDQNRFYPQSHGKDDDESDSKRVSFEGNELDENMVFTSGSDDARAGSAYSNKAGDWYADTPPLVVLRHYAADSITDEQIEKVLKENSIATLKDLSKNIRCATFLDNDAFEQITSGVLYRASKRIRKTIEEVLGGQLVYNKVCILPKSLDLFTAGAVSVAANTTESTPDTMIERNTRFNLVLGPSGSGKTSFALKRLPNILCDQADKMVFTIHFMADEADCLARTKNVSFPDAVANLVQRKTMGYLNQQGFRDDVTSAYLYLHVVIDEAGDESFTKYFDEAVKIDEINSSIENSYYKFQCGVQLTIAGTGLDKTTANISSVNEANKFRMQPWTRKNFEALVTKSNHNYQELVLEAVERFPLLQDLTTNGRCAVFVLRAMNSSTVIRKYKLKHFVPDLISEVAECYVSSNGLKKLVTTIERWSMARAVFTELDKATSHPGIPFFAEFEELKDRPKLRNAAHSLLDVNVETEGDRLQLVNNNNYSLSISPALVIVLATFLNVQAGITWNWQGFESLAVLGELKRIIARSQGTPKDLNRLIVELEIPAPASNTTFSVPYVDNFTVVLNGPLSSYADVIAPYRLVQAKFSRDVSKTKSLELQRELDKMGLTNSSKFTIQKHLTRLFYSMWEKPQTIPPAVVVALDNSANKCYRFECFPINMLNSRQHFEHQVMLKGSMKKKTGKCTIVGKPEKDLVQEFNSSRPVTAVFVTNCNAFKLAKTDISISPADVDWEGRLKGDKLPYDVIASLKKHVEIRFLFF